MGTENVLPISVDRNAVGDRESIGQEVVVGVPGWRRTTQG